MDAKDAMRYFLATISDRAPENWAICKRWGLWGTKRGASRAKHAAKLIQPGDGIFVWQAGQPPALLALAQATGNAYEPDDQSDVPWGSPQSYEYLIPIRVVDELAEPATDEMSEGQLPKVSRRFGVSSDKERSGFVKLDEQEAARLLRAFDGEQPAAPRPAAPQPEHAERRPISAVLLRSTQSVAEALLHIQEHLPDDEQVEVLIVGDEPDSRAVDAELASGRFPALEDRLRFVTREGLARELGADL